MWIAWMKNGEIFDEKEWGGSLDGAIDNGRLLMNTQEMDAFVVTDYDRRDVLHSEERNK